MKTENVFLNSGEIRLLLGRVRHRLTHRVNLLKSEELQFLDNIDYQLRVLGKDVLSIKQMDWLLAIIEKTDVSKPKPQPAAEAWAELQAA